MTTTHTWPAQTAETFQRRAQQLRRQVQVRARHVRHQRPEVARPARAHQHRAQHLVRLALLADVDQLCGADGGRCMHPGPRRRGPHGGRSAEPRCGRGFSGPRIRVGAFSARKNGAETANRRPSAGLGPRRQRRNSAPFERVRAPDGRVTDMVNLAESFFSFLGIELGVEARGVFEVLRSRICAVE